MKKPRLSNSQKAALVALNKCCISQQKIDRYTSSVTLDGVEYQHTTLDSLVKYGAVKKNKTNTSLKIPAHYTLTELGNAWAEQLPMDLEKKKWTSPWQAHLQSRGEHMTMQSALVSAGSHFRSSTIYELMQSKGLLYKASRLSSSGEEVSFRKLTETGEQFGRNIPAPHPEETEAVFHPNEIPSLLRHLGLL